VVTAAPNPSRAGQPVTFTARVTATGTGVTGGTVTFADRATTMGADVPVDDQGRATFTTATLIAGTHLITATYHPSPGWAGSTSGPLTHLVDGDAPRANPTLSPRTNAAGWHHAPVTVTWNWTDQGAGVDPAACPDRSSTNREGRRTLRASCRDMTGNESSTQRTVRIDQTAPTVTITAPARRYYQHADVSADYICRDALSGVSDCTGTVAVGAPIDTSAVGAHQFTVAARDVAGNETTAKVTYVVRARPTCHGLPATIIGTDGNDVITGTAGPDVIVTGGGRDGVRSHGGDDTICTGGDSDVVDAGSGDDTISTGSGRDSVVGGLGANSIIGGPQGDTLVGGPQADTLSGGAGKDTLLGQGDDDHLTGGPRYDICRGGLGNDHATTCELTLSIP
jgi:Ca2+-binding RTX toxin-like protein